MYGTFPYVIEREKDMGGYTAESPGMQGALTWGRTLSDAKKAIKEAIEGAIEARAIVQAERSGSIRVTRTPIQELVA